MQCLSRVSKIDDKICMLQGLIGTATVLLHLLCNVYITIVLPVFLLHAVGSTLVSRQRKVFVPRNLMLVTTFISDVFRIKIN